MIEVELTDDVVTLHPFQIEDAAQLYKAVHESLTELKPWMSWAQDAYSQPEACDFILITRARWEERDLFAFAITDANTGEILGGCSLSHIHPVYHLCNVGYWYGHHGMATALLVTRRNWRCAMVLSTAGLCMPKS